MSLDIAQGQAWHSVLAYFLSNMLASNMHHQRPCLAVVTQGQGIHVHLVPQHEQHACAAREIHWGELQCDSSRMAASQEKLAIKHAIDQANANCSLKDPPAYQPCRGATGGLPMEY